MSGILLLFWDILECWMPCRLIQLVKVDRVQVMLELLISWR